MRFLYFCILRQLVFDNIKTIVIYLGKHIELHSAEAYTKKIHDLIQNCGQICTLINFKFQSRILKIFFTMPRSWRYFLIIISINISVLPFSFGLFSVWRLYSYATFIKNFLDYSCLQCCVRFCCTAKWTSHMCACVCVCVCVYTYIHMLLLLSCFSRVQPCVTQ